MSGSFRRRDDGWRYDWSPAQVLGGILLLAIVAMAVGSMVVGALSERLAPSAMAAVSSATATSPAAGWRVRSVSSVEEAADLLGTLSFEQARDAKVVFTSNSFSFGSVRPTNLYVLYPAK